MKRPTKIGVFILLILLSVAGYALAMPRLSFWWLSFVCLIPFFAALDQSDSPVKTFLFGVSWGAGTALALGYWLFFTLLNHYEVTLGKSLVFFLLCLVLPVAGIYLIFGLAYRFFRRDSLFFYGIIVPSAWVCLEYIKAAVPVLIPWGGLDCALVGFFRFVQIVDVTGPYGLIWIAVAINGLAFLCLKDVFRFFRDRRRRVLIRAGFGMILISLLFAVPMGYGDHRLRHYPDSIRRCLADPEARIRATLVQGNFSTKERWSGMGFYQRVARYLELSTDKTHSGQRVIVWPENTLNVTSKLDDALFLELMRGIGENTLLISGGLCAEEATGEVLNSAYFISGSGRLMRYDKRILLPYSETSPLIDLLDAYYTAPSEFKAGKTPAYVDSVPGPAGPSICFEILYPELMRESVRNGARYLVNLSNDSWFGNSPMPWVHLNAARLRAIENRRFLLRASTSGISALIDPTGKPVAQSRLFTQERLDADFVGYDSITFFTRRGEWVLLTAAGVILLALIQVVLKEHRLEV